MNHPREIPAARRPSRLHPDLVTDEIDFLRQLVPLAGARLVELGCGKADLARKLLARGMVASVDAFEVDERQHAANLASAHPPRCVSSAPAPKRCRCPMPAATAC
jgi:hypothetical protein